MEGQARADTEQEAYYFYHILFGVTLAAVLQFLNLITNILSFLIKIRQHKMRNHQILELGEVIKINDTNEN